MFQNLLLSSITPLSDKNEIHCWENRPFTSTWPEPRQEKSNELIKRTIKKKPKRVRTSFSTGQLRLLENSFSRNRYINAESRRELASCLKIEEKTIKVWFQNRRMKEKRDSSDSSCDSSSESFSNVSLPASIQIDQQAPESSWKPFEDQTNQSEVAQYQLPNSIYINNYVPLEEYRKHGLCDETPAMSFGYDAGNVHPTQHYPIRPDYYTNAEANLYYSTISDNNNWSNTFDLSYF